MLSWLTAGALEKGFVTKLTLTLLRPTSLRTSAFVVFLQPWSGEGTDQRR